MLLEDIPCIVNKCLLYPICKAKEIINCGALHGYYELNRAQCNNHYKFIIIVDEYIISILENIVVLYTDDKLKSYLIRPITYNHLESRIMKIMKMHKKVLCS